MPIYAKTRALPTGRCPHCRMEMDCVTGISSRPEGTIPTDGDLTICMYCATALAWHEGALVLASQEDVDRSGASGIAIVEAVLKKPIVVRG